MRLGPIAPQRIGQLRHGAATAIRILVALGCAALGLGSLAAGNVGGATIGLVLAAAFGASASRTGGRARAARATARARRTSARELRTLAEQGWDVSHALRWPGGTRLDHFATAPEAELSFAIMAAASWPGPAALNEITARAGWFALSGPPCVPVCAVAGRWQEALEDGVLVVSAEALAQALIEARLGYRANGGGASADPRAGVGEVLGR